MAICGRLEFRGKACLAPAIDNSILKKGTFINIILLQYITSIYYYFIVMISICFSSRIQSHIICKKCMKARILVGNHLHRESSSLIGWKIENLSLIGGFWITLNVPERMVARSSMETLSMSPSKRPALWMGSASKRKISSTESAALPRKQLTGLNNYESMYLLHVHKHEITHQNSGDEPVESTRTIKTIKNKKISHIQKIIINFNMNWKSINEISGVLCIFH